MTTLFVGTGTMGEPMATRHAAKFNTVVHDASAVVAAAVSERIGVGSLASLEDVPDDVDVVILMLPSSAVVEAVLVRDGLLDILPAGSLVVDMSSSEPKSTQELAHRATGRGVGYVDAPVSGGVKKARTGELSILVGGEPDDVARATPHLETMGSTIIHLGRSGAGHAAKALNNIVSATNIAIAAEAVSVASSFGIRAADMVRVLNASTGRSQASEVKYPQHILPGTYDSGFAFDLMLKDVGIALRLARQTGTETPVAEALVAVAEQARSTLSTGHPDHTELARYYERLNHVDFTDGARQEEPG